MKSPAAAVLPEASRSAYSMHGVDIAIECDEPTLLSRLQGRLAPFRARFEEDLEAQLQFEFRIAEAGNRIKEVPGPLRTVYRVAEIEFRYDTKDDLLWVSCGNRLIGVCYPNLGVARFEVGADAAADLELYSQTAFTICLIELMKRQGRFSLHAAGISVGGAGILFAGPSGAGKSTLAILLMQSLGQRAGFLGDDMLFLSAGTGDIKILGWPEQIAVGEFTQRSVLGGEARLQVTATGRRKGQIAASRIAGSNPAFNAGPEVIIFPRVTGWAKSVLTPISQDEALLELAPNVLLTEATSSRAHLAALGALARRCRCYRLEAGSDIVGLRRLLLTLI